MTAEEVYKTQFKPDYCIGCTEVGCAKQVPCYTDPETGAPLCLACIESECENVALGLGHYADPLEEPPLEFPSPDAGNGYADRTNPKLRTIGTR